MELTCIKENKLSLAPNIKDNKEVIAIELEIFEMDDVNNDYVFYKLILYVKINVSVKYIVYAPYYGYECINAIDDFDFIYIL